MKTRLFSCLVIAASLSGCSLFSPAPTTTGAVIPAPTVTTANFAKGTQAVIFAVATGFLANNPKYASETVAAADALVALAATNPATLTASDLTAALANTGLSSKTQASIGQYATSALGIYETDFAVNLPTLKPQYGLFLIAVANGLYQANGKAALPLPAVSFIPKTFGSATHVAVL